MKFLLIAKSYYRKNRNMSLTLLLLITFASILLYIGTSVVLDIDSYLDDKNTSLNYSDFTVVVPTELNHMVQSVFKEMGSYDQIEEMESMKFSAVFKNITLGEKSQSLNCLLLNADRHEEISTLKIIDQGETKLSNSIILPYYLKVAKGYRTGDEIKISNGSQERTYIIYGFAEDIMYATPSNITCYKVYIFDEEFAKLKEKKEYIPHQFIKTKMNESTDVVLYSNLFIKKLNKLTNGAMVDITIMDYDTMKIGVGVFLIIIMSVFIAFSAIIILIALTVMRFAIVTQIEGNIKNIGSMEALGYTGNELVTSTVLQYSLIAILGTLLGITIGIFSSRLMTNLISSSIGMAWNPSINLLAIVINYLVILSLVIMITFLAASKIKRITPIMALRNGIETHNFKKNYFAFHKSPFNVHISSGLKALMQNMHQNMIILIIILLMSFVCVFTYTINYNFNIDDTAALSLVGIEKSQILVSFSDEESIKLFDEIAGLEHVKKTTRLMNLNMTVTKDELESLPMIKICNDYSMLEIKTIVEGRNPIHDNEISLTGLVMERLNAKIGDVILLGDYDNKKEFIIVGENQQITNLGKGGCITEEGMMRIKPDFSPSGLYLYLEDSEQISEVMKEIEDKYKDFPLEVLNLEENFDTVMESFNMAIKSLCAACIVITLAIIALILYLLIKIKLLKEKLRIGIAKALGYTTSQIILQIVVGFCPVCILGALIGTVLAMFLINPTFALMLSVSGIRNSHFTINPLMTLLTFLGISLFSVLITALVSRSIKRITPCELFVS